MDVMALQMKTRATKSNFVIGGMLAVVPINQNIIEILARRCGFNVMVAVERITKLPKPQDICRSSLGTNDLGGLGNEQDVLAIGVVDEKGLLSVFLGDNEDVIELKRLFGKDPIDAVHITALVSYQEIVVCLGVKNVLDVNILLGKVDTLESRGARTTPADILGEACNHNVIDLLQAVGLEGLTGS